MNWSELRKVIALVSINILAFWFDQQWLYAAMGIDFAVLGYELKNYAKTTSEKNASIS